MWGRSIPWVQQSGPVLTPGHHLEMWMDSWSCAVIRAKNTSHTLCPRSSSDWDGYCSRITYWQPGQQYFWFSHCVQSPELLLSGGISFITEGRPFYWFFLFLFYKRFFLTVWCHVSPDLVKLEIFVFGSVVLDRCQLPLSVAFQRDDMQYYRPKTVAGCVVI